MILNKVGLVNVIQTQDKCANGKKKSHFEQDLLKIFTTTLDQSTFASRFAGYKSNEIIWFLKQTKQNTIRPNETEGHCRNKLSSWLDRMHIALSHQQVKPKYFMWIVTTKSHINDILQAIVKHFKNDNVISFPNIAQRKQMGKILKAKGADFSDAECSMDGSCVKCSAWRFEERLSHKC